MENFDKLHSIHQIFTMLNFSAVWYSFHVLPYIHTLIQLAMEFTHMITYVHETGQ